MASATLRKAKTGRASVHRERDLGLEFQVVWKPLKPQLTDMSRCVALLGQPMLFLHHEQFSWRRTEFRKKKHQASVHRAAAKDTGAYGANREDRAVVLAEPSRLSPKPKSSRPPSLRSSRGCLLASFLGICTLSLHLHCNNFWDAPMPNQRPTACSSRLGHPGSIILLHCPGLSLQFPPTVNLYSQRSLCFILVVLSCVAGLLGLLAADLPLRL